MFLNFFLLKWGKLAKERQMPKELEISEDFSKAFELIEKSNKHLFITGKAGSGKSTFLEYCQNHLNKNMVMLAPTGVSALNIKGQTIHRFFGFPVNISVEKIKSLEFTPRAKRIYKNLETLIIDEVSMLRADLLDCINCFLELYGPVKGAPFGGVQVVFVGDLYQLPPVISKAEAPYFYQKYETAYFFSAEVFKKIPLEVIELKKIYRQKDQDFIEMLSRFRNNTVTKEDIQKLNSRLNQEQKFYNLTEFQIFLTATNLQAEKINQQHLEKLDGITYCSDAFVEGNFNQDSYPTAETLYFKIGSQIMFLNNDSKNRWVNGSLGYIEKIFMENGKIKHISVRLMQDYKLVEVFPYSWEIFKYKIEGKEIISEVAGSFTQFPFRLAWAVTIHKSQGKTFDHVVIDIGQGTFATGQLYVALSRCTSFEGISLTKAISPRHILTDEKINDFLSTYLPHEQTLAEKSKILQESIYQKNKLLIEYTKANGEESKRMIIPQHISKNNLLAYCIQRNEQRTFVIERIKSIKILKNNN